MSEKDFVKKYLEDFSNLLKPQEDIVTKIISARDILVGANRNKKKNYDFWKWWKCSHC